MVVTKLEMTGKLTTRSSAERRPSLLQSMMPKASLNCWMAEWEKESKILAFLGMVKFYVFKWRGKKSTTENDEIFVSFLFLFILTVLFKSYLTFYLA